MKSLKHILIGLALSLPIWTIFGAMLAWLILDYDRLYAIKLGPFITISCLILGVGSLIMPFLNIGTVRKKDWRTAWREHTYLPMRKFFVYVPLVILGFWGWTWIALVPVIKVSKGALPEGLLFLMAMLMPVNEFFKGRERYGKLQDYQKSLDEGSRELEPLLWGYRKLRMILFIEPLAYMLLVWGGLVALIAPGEELLAAYLGFELRSLLYLVLFVGIIFATQFLEKRWLAYGRRRFLIPW
jgi:hypothetical protein